MGAGSLKLVLAVLGAAAVVTFMICVVWRMVLYQTEVFRVLGKHGRRAYWTFGAAQQRQLEEYREVCVEQGYPLDKYRACRRCYRVAIGAWVAGLMVIVALAFVGR